VINGNAMMFANGALFDLVLGRYVAANPSAFSGVRAVPAIGIEFEFGIDGTPKTLLAPQTGGGNVGIVLPLELDIYAFQNGQRGKRENVLGVSVTVEGTLALQGQTLRLTNLMTTGTPDVLGQKVAAMFNEKVLPVLEGEVSQIPLPDLTKVLGVPVQVVDVQVVNGQVAVSAQVAGGSGQVDIPYSPPPFPAVTAAIAGDAINALARAQFQPQTANAGAHNSTAGFGYDAQAQAGAGNPQLSISGGQAEGTLDVWAWAKGGIEVAWKWIEPELGISSKVPPLGLRLVASGAGTGLDIKLYLTGSVHFDIGLPSELEKVADDILKALGTLGQDITAKINGALDPITIHAFALPTTVPGTNLTATLSFASQGFTGNAAYAIVGVK
jgi:hypothetical protein